MSASVDVPAWVAGVGGLRVTAGPGGHREPGPACGEVEEGVIDYASASF